MPFFLYFIHINNENTVILCWGRNLQGRTGKGPKPLGAEPEKGRNLWHSFSQTVPKLGYFPNCKGPGPIPNKLKKTCIMPLGSLVNIYTPMAFYCNDA